MIKREELANPKSCMSRAEDDEMTFVLLSRDAAAPVAIHAWVIERIRIGKNHPMDAQIVDALGCAEYMRAEYCLGQPKTQFIPASVEQPPCPVTPQELRDYAAQLDFQGQPAWLSREVRAWTKKVRALADWLEKRGQNG